MIKCEICGELMKKQHTWFKHKIKYKDYYDKYLKTDLDGICVVCGKPTSWDRINYKRTCSVQCAAKNPERQEKIKNTNLQRHGVENAYQIPEVKQHSIEAIKDQKRNYKRLFCGKDTGIKKFCSEECKINYKNSNNSYNNREQAKQTCIELFDGKMNGGAWETRFNNIEQFEKEHNCTSINKLIHLYGQWVKGLDLPRLYINKQNNAISNEYLPLIIEYSKLIAKNPQLFSMEQLLYEYLKTFYNNIILHNRQVIKPLEIDIYLPDLKLGIEYNGMYWHSIECGKSKEYHLDKSLRCREKGIRLIHIYEFEDFEQQKQLLTDLINGIDNYPKQDFNKNNLIDSIPEPEIIYNDKKFTIYGAGSLY